VSKDVGAIWLSYHKVEMTGKSKAVVVNNNNSLLLEHPAPELRSELSLRALRISKDCAPRVEINRGELPSTFWARGDCSKQQYWQLSHTKVITSPSSRCTPAPEGDASSNRVVGQQGCGSPVTVVESLPRLPSMLSVLVIYDKQLLS
jgi:hypothetical protein